jgi:hypothetical protein
MPCFVERSGFTGGQPARASAASTAPRGVPPSPPRSRPASAVSHARPAAPSRLSQRPKSATPAPGPRGLVPTGFSRETTNPPIEIVSRSKAVDRDWESSLKASSRALRTSGRRGGRGPAHLLDAVDGARRSAATAAAVDAREKDYRAQTLGQRDLVHVSAENGLNYSYDATPAPAKDEPANRVVVAWGRSGRPAGPKDAVRLRGFPSPAGKSPQSLDRGHLVAHSFGGSEEGINLIPQNRALNRGWSEEGKSWRRLESDLAARPGTEFFVRPLYRDSSDLPCAIEFGVQREDGEWDSDIFRNR